MENRQGMDTRSIAALAVGAGLGIVAFVAHQFHKRREERQRQFVKELNSVRKDVDILKDEVSFLRERQLRGLDATDSKPKLRKKRMRSAASGYDSESTMYTAQASEEDEFYDISSDEDGLTLASGDGSDLQDFFEKVDAMMENNQNVLENLLSHADKFGTNPNFLWRLAKAYKLEHDAVLGDKVEQMKFLEIGYQHARKAVDLDETNGYGHKWLAILIGLKTELLPTMDKLPNGILFQKHLNLALELLPRDFSLYYLLASFKFAIANLSWFEKKAAKLLVELPDVSMDDVLMDARTSEELSPMPENRLLMAKAFFAKNDSKSGLHWLHKTNEIVKQDSPVCNEVAALIFKYQ